MENNNINYDVVEKDGILVKQKIDKGMMNLHNKSFMELDKDELHREIDYLWGQYDFVSQSKELPKEYKINKANYIWDQINIMTTRYISLSMRDINKSKNNISDENRKWWKIWGN